ncbi:NUDIX domain-containing protein [Actinokineospora sp. NBRC 105648]|uniref:NUDIX hydrolase n=1 Tax=Actinokineospora sp. NBRC 105648 TaxID=3032206 RepID=UPI0024A30D79|nr:NUDIX domain-containing protein [Actinokineospora sp. NBRC 105648]GLZ37750.1 NUDIX hydrolase [Actinokineospora sp. NBRC 105648]
MSQYGYSDTATASRASVGVGVLVLDDAGLLLLRHDGQRDRCHRLPGGPQPTGDTLSESAVRAVEEQTGVRVEITGLIGVYSDDSQPWSTELAVCFRGRPVGGRLRTDRARWVEPERPAELALPAGSRAVVEHCVDESEPYFT